MTVKEKAQMLLDKITEHEMCNRKEFQINFTWPISGNTITYDHADIFSYIKYFEPFNSGQYNCMLLFNAIWKELHFDKLKLLVSKLESHPDVSHRYDGLTWDINDISSWILQHRTVNGTMMKVSNMLWAECKKHDKN